MKERVTFPTDFWELGKFFFIAPTSFDESVVSKKWNDDVVKVLTGYKDALCKLTVLDAATAKSTLEQVAAQVGIQTGKIMQAFRISITGGASGPDLMVTLEIIGRDESIRRIEYALKTLKAKVA